MSPHRQTFSALVKKHGWTRGAELGVDKGLLFNRLLTDHPSLTLIGVDVCPVPHRLERCREIETQYADRATLLVMTTTAAAYKVADRSLDFVFIDADHTEEGAAADIAEWTSKVRPGGWVGGHDYNVKTFPGVVAAVDRAFGPRVMTYQPGHIWGVWC